jgi:hypothetical protein
MMTPRVPETTIPSTTRAVGGFFLAMGGVHVGIVSADTETYRHFADRALFGFVRTGWSDIFMASPHLWGLALAAAELLMGVLLLSGGRPSRIGWIGVVTFHVLLMLFGWGIWAWCLPALFFLVRSARKDWAPLAGQAPSGMPGTAAPTGQQSRTPAHDR